MTKLSTPTDISKLSSPLRLDEKITVLGSCFADNMGARLADAGFDVCVNPFGTLYNPISIYNSAARLSSDFPFGPSDCVQMGAGAGKICSWWHHTSFAREDTAEFLQNANAALSTAACHWKESSRVIITLGTAMVWKLLENGEVVSNCLKRPSAEFSHEMIDADTVASVMQRLIRRFPEKQFIFSVSPVRHPGEGMHRNTISKATLQIGLDRALQGSDAYYFPAYEILLDELRDYRFYADDMLHPSKLSVDLIAEKFLDACTALQDRSSIDANIKKAAAAAHRPIARR